MNETIRPILDWVVLEPMGLEEKTSGGIYVPKTAKNNRRRGTVKAVGPGRWLELGKRVEPEVKAGDVVIYMHHNVAQGVSDVEDEQGLQLIPANEICAVVERGK